MKLFEIGNFYIASLYDSCGLISFGFTTSNNNHEYVIHFLVSREYWQWGYQKDWYDGPLPSFGLGPFALICWR